MSSLAPELRKLLASGVELLGFELVDAELAGGHHVVLRVYIDNPNGVSIDDCADVSRQLSAILDVEDPFSGSYSLEVSSPGFDRPLVKPADFERFAGEVIKVKLRQPIEGRRNFKGRLLGLTGEDVVLLVDDQQISLALDGIERARLVPDYA